MKTEAVKSIDKFIEIFQSLDGTAMPTEAYPPIYNRSLSEASKLLRSLFGNIPSLDGGVSMGPQSEPELIAERFKYYKRNLHNVIKALKQYRERLIHGQ